MRVTLLDLSVGNLHSLEKAFARSLPGAVVTEASDVGAALETDLLVLPGVGAFEHAATVLAPQRSLLLSALERGLPVIGICLGMQLMFERSEEGPGRGLGYFAGDVTRLSTPRTPHMGWSRLVARGATPPLPSAVYYAHSFACRPQDPRVILAESTADGDTFPAIVRRGKVVGFQFHPEKSSDEGVALLAAMAQEITA